MSGGKVVSFTTAGGAGYTEWEQAYGYVNALDHGVKGDGVTDDTAAINAGMAKVPAGGVYYMPPGKTYLVSGSLTPPASVMDFICMGTILYQTAVAATILNFAGALCSRIHVHSLQSGGIGVGLAVPTAPANGIPSRITVGNLEAWVTGVLLGNSPSYALLEIEQSQSNTTAINTQGYGAGQVRIGTSTNDTNIISNMNGGEVRIGACSGTPTLTLQFDTTVANLIEIDSWAGTAPVVNVDLAQGPVTLICPQALTLQNVSAKANIYRHITAQTALAAIAAPTSGTVYQNTGTRGLHISIPVTFSALSTAAATVAVAFGPTTPPATQYTDSVPAASLAGIVRAETFFVPPGWFWSMTVTNATLGAGASVEA